MGVAQIGLHGQAHVGPVAELGFVENLPETLQHDVFEIVLFHVQGDEGLFFPSATQDGTQTFANGLDAALGIQRIDLGIQRGQFQ